MLTDISQKLQCMWPSQMHKKYKTLQNFLILCNIKQSFVFLCAGNLLYKWPYYITNIILGPLQKLKNTYRTYFFIWWIIQIYFVAIKQTYFGSTTVFLLSWPVTSDLLVSEVIVHDKILLTHFLQFECLTK